MMCSRLGATPRPGAGDRGRGDPGIPWEAIEGLSRPLRCLGVLVPILAGCASGSGLPPETERAIETYYASHASEEGGRCPAPFIDGFTRTQVVEEGPERQVVDVRYLYGDRIKDRSDSNGRQCLGYDGRRFTLAKTETGVEVIEMTGPSRR